MSENAQKETLGFQTEVTRLLDLMIRSLYSNKEIFLRELISNAADATDMLRFEALGNDKLYEGDTELNIHVGFDKKARTITITDNGIGMDRQEVIDNIGTIAKSGTRQFFNSLTGDQAKDAQLIGQFGVGFYSSFIVANKVELISRRAGTPAEQAVHWQSTGEGEYTIETVERKMRGTEVILHLRKGEDELLDGYRLRHIIKKYSDHISMPILMKSEDKDKDEDETINSASALWARPKSEISDEEYNEFYKHVGHDFEDPLAYIHSHVEGKQEYTSLLFIPQRAPFDLWDQNRRHGIKLYVQRVFIMDDAEQLMPNYLRFIRGVIDSNDLPLNISREILQHSKDIDAIRAGSIKKVLGMMEKLAKDDSEKYATLWKEFGRVLKEGIIEDTSNRDQIAKLLRFSTTRSESEAQDVSLSDYVERMKKGQENIYYVTADSLSAAQNSPHLEIFKKKGIEVLLLHDRVDEWVTTHLNEFDKKPLVSVTKGDLDLGKMADKKEKKKEEETAKASKELIDRMQKCLEDRVKEVRVSHRLTESPSCLVSAEEDMGGNMERILKEAGHKMPVSKKILEINPEHPIVLRLKAEKSDEQFNDWSHILFDQALLAEGSQLDDPAGFVHRLNGLLLDLSGKK